MNGDVSVYGVDPGNNNIFLLETAGGDEVIERMVAKHPNIKIMFAVYSNGQIIQIIRKPGYDLRQVNTWSGGFTFRDKYK